MIPNPDWSRAAGRAGRRLWRAGRGGNGARWESPALFRREAARSGVAPRGGSAGSGAAAAVARGS